MTTACERDGPPISLLEDRDLAMEVIDFKAAVLQKWNEAGIDAYISPVNPAVAPRHGDYSKVRYFAYTAMANVLNYPAYTLPAPCPCVLSTLKSTWRMTQADQRFVRE